MTKFRIRIIQDKRAKIRNLDSKDINAFDFLKLIGGYFSLPETRRISIEKVI